MSNRTHDPMLDRCTICRGPRYDHLVDWRPGSHSFETELVEEAVIVDLRTIPAETYHRMDHVHDLDGSCAKNRTGAMCSYRQAVS